MNRRLLHILGVGLAITALTTVVLRFSSELSVQAASRRVEVAAANDLSAPTEALAPSSAASTSRGLRRGRTARARRSVGGAASRRGRGSDGRPRPSPWPRAGTPSTWRWSRSTPRR